MNIRYGLIELLFRVELKYKTKSKTDPNLDECRMNLKDIGIGTESVY